MKTKPKTKNATKLAGWRAKLVADGGRVITTALSPVAVMAIDKLKACGGRSTRDAIEFALVQAASITPFRVVTVGGKTDPATVAALIASKAEGGAP